MNTKTVLAALAVSTLALAQPAAAATRSYQSLPQAGAQVAPAARAGAISSDSEAAVGGLLPLWVILAVFAAVAAAVATSTGNKSPG